MTDLHSSVMHLCHSRGTWNHWNPLRSTGIQLVRSKWASCTSVSLAVGQSLRSRPSNIRREYLVHQTFNIFQPQQVASHTATVLLGKHCKHWVCMIVRCIWIQQPCYGASQLGHRRTECFCLNLIRIADEGWSRCTCSSVPSESTMSTQQNPWDPNSAVTGKLIMSECNLLMIFKDLGVAGLPLQVKASGRKCRCWPATPRSWNVRARFSRGSAYQASPAPVVTKFPGVALRVDIEKAQLESVQISPKIRLCTCLQSKSAKSIQRSFTQPKKGAGIDEGSLRNLSSDKVRAWLIRAFSCRTTKAAPLREESTEEWPTSAPVGFSFCNGLDRKW